MFYADPKNLMVFKEQPTVIERTLYDKTLKKIYAVFDEKNIFTYFYEDLFRDRHAARDVITELLKFLELPVTKRCFELFDQKFGAVPFKQMPVEYREQLNREYLNTILKVKERIGRVPSEWKTGD
jgi:hypothetical protein